jgi:transposase
MTDQLARDRMAISTLAFHSKHWRFDERTAHLRRKRIFLFDTSTNDLNLIERFVQSICFRLEDLLDDIYAFGHASEDGVFIF